MRLLHRLALVVPVSLTLAAANGAAQSSSQPPAKAAKPAAMDHGTMDHGKMDHAAMHAEHVKQQGKGDAAWKALDAYHALMMATWHPAKDKGDLAPTRAQIGAMVTAAKAVASSKAPATCATPAMAGAQAGLVGETEKVAALVSAKADDAALKAAMKTLHDRFEVLEEGCNTGMKH
ncbi:MAG: hypothetical protein RLZZ621_1243 [Gemmatimonadota bacterium]|jgi:hypothetical protein